MNLVVQFNAIALLYAGLYSMLYGTLDAVFVDTSIHTSTASNSNGNVITASSAHMDPNGNGVGSSSGSQGSDDFKDLECINMKNRSEQGTVIVYPVLAVYAIFIVVWLVYMIRKTDTFNTRVKSIAWVRNWAMIKKDKWYRRFIYTLAAVTLLLYVSVFGYMTSKMPEPDQQDALQAGRIALSFGCLTVFLSLFSLYSPNAETILIGEEAGKLGFNVPFYSNADRIWEIITDGVIAAKLGDDRLLAHYGMTPDDIQELLKQVSVNDDLTDFGITDDGEGKVEVQSGNGLPAMAVSSNVGVIASLSSVASFA